MARLLKDAGIVRHRGKIESTINNASRAQRARSTSTARSRRSSGATSPPPPSGRGASTLPALTKLATTPASTRLSKELKARGFSFVGPTTVYAFMQAMGLVNDHLEGCAIRERAERARVRFRRPRREAAAIREAPSS